MSCKSVQFPLLCESIPRAGPQVWALWSTSARTIYSFFLQRNGSVKAIRKELHLPMFQKGRHTVLGRKVCLSLCNKGGKLHSTRSCLSLPYPRLQEVSQPRVELTPFWPIGLWEWGQNIKRKAYLYFVFFSSSSSSSASYSPSLCSPPSTLSLYSSSPLSIYSHVSLLLLASLFLLHILSFSLASSSFFSLFICLLSSPTSSMSPLHCIFLFFVALFLPVLSPYSVSSRSLLSFSFSFYCFSFCFLYSVLPASPSRCQRLKGLHLTYRPFPQDLQF